MVVARKYIVVKRFQGLPKRDDFEIVEETLPPLQNGEILVQAEYLSVDPYLRVYGNNISLPYDQFGFQVARVVESKDIQFPVGSHVTSHVGWRDFSILNMSKKANSPSEQPQKLPDIGPLPVSHGIGAVGMPGATAYFGFLEICQPKAGETVVVTGAAGAVGSIVGQIAKIKGCKVIGFAGSEKKVNILTHDYGYDHAFNYKTCDVAQALKEAAPDGVDCYFDNVGGEISSTVINNMNTFGRVATCGSISTYNQDTLPKAVILQPALVAKQLKIEGFLVWRWFEQFSEAYQQLAQWIHAGELVASEHVTQGFDNIVEAFTGMLQGDNAGKAVVKV